MKRFEGVNVHIKSLFCRTKGDGENPELNNVSFLFSRVRSCSSTESEHDEIGDGGTENKVARDKIANDDKKNWMRQECGRDSGRCGNRSVYLKYGEGGVGDGEGGESVKCLGRAEFEGLLESLLDRQVCKRKHKVVNMTL